MDVSAKNALRDFDMMPPGALAPLRKRNGCKD